jgi:hypothetical protein
MWYEYLCYTLFICLDCSGCYSCCGFCDSSAGQQGKWTFDHELPNVFPTALVFSSRMHE